MAANPTLLCIHRDPARLKVLRENGYELLTAGNGREGLRLFRSRPVDGIVLEYYLGLLDGAFIASGIKQVRPTIPIVMVAEHAELPDGALQAVDVLVSTSDPPHFLWAAVHFMLNVKPAQSSDPLASTLATQRNAPFSPKEWKSIRNGTIQF